ncbi:MAG: HEAT repeat domain-containing protein [candidate division WOR-3 bacterium]|nr:MAG: HEAT repeat domain-containing protein [candidate division WOR-3 bacterium]
MKDLQILLTAVLLLTCCSDPVAEARKDLDSLDPEKRAGAARFLGEKKDKESVPRLVRMLADEDVTVRMELVRALGNIGASEAARPLVEMYSREEDEGVSRAASRAMVKIGSPSVQPLVEVLGSRRPEVRAGAARTLGKIGSQRAVDPLIRLIDDRDPDVRRAAIHSLRSIGGSRALDAIARSVQDRDRDVESTAEDALSGPGYEDQLDRAKQLIRGAVR